MEDSRVLAISVHLNVETVLNYEICMYSSCISMKIKMIEYRSGIYDCVKCVISCKSSYQIYLFGEW